MNSGTLLRAVGALALLATPVQAQTPAARQLVDRYVEQIGGADAVLSHETWTATGTFAMAAAGISGPIHVYQDGERSFSRISVPGVGELLRGFDGTTGWSINPLEGPRLLEGRELAQTREEATRGAALRDRSVVTSMETLEKTTMNEQECWLVKLVWKSGRETRDCYSVETGLLVATTGKTTTPMGEFEYTTLINDYKQFGDLKIATRIVQTALGQQQVVTTDSIEFGPVADSIFALPDPIKALTK